MESFDNRFTLQVDFKRLSLYNLMNHVRKLKTSLILIYVLLWGKQITFVRLKNIYKRHSVVIFWREKNDAIVLTAPINPYKKRFFSFCVQGTKIFFQLRGI